MQPALTTHTVQFYNLREKPSWLLRFVLFFIYLSAVVASAMVAGFLSMYVLFAPSLMLHKIQDYRPQLVTRVLSVDHDLIGEFSTERRIVLPFEQIPKTLIQAFIASEDAHFFDHQGIDYVGLVRSAIKTATAHGQQGGSTISMQVAKSFLDPQIRKGAKAHSWLAKIRYKMSQIFLARQFEKSLSKDEILYLYLNQIYLGHGAYGVQAAAENYFRKNVSHLTLSEQSLLAGLPQAPSRYSPFTYPDRAKERQRYVLRRMREENFISQHDYEKALAAPLQVFPLEDPFREMAPHFVEAVRRELMEHFGEKAIYEEGLTVYTTVDVDRQMAAEKAVANGLHELDKRQGFRGPLLTLNPAQEDDFLKRYEHTLSHTRPQTDPISLALVTQVSPLAAEISIGNKKGQIPIAAMTWARAPNPLVYYEYVLQNDATKILHRGDVVMVRPTSKEALQKISWARPWVGKISGERPLFTLEQEPIAESALFSANPHTGYVEAMIGGYDFDHSELNRTMQACRQPGSAFKPVIYSAAFDTQDFTASTILQDTPVVFDDPDHQVRWKPENSHEEFRGDVTVRTAIKDSLNIPAVKTLEKVGIETAITYARRLGITTKINRDFSLALGGSCVTMWDLATVYGVIANLGFKPRYHLITRVVDRDGRILLDNGDVNDPVLPLSSHLHAVRRDIYAPKELVLDPTTAYLMVRQLTNVVQGGTGSYAAKVGKNVAGKTGTTNDQFDAWFMGFSRDLVTGVWVGHDKNERPLGRNEFGGRAALPIWTDYMIAALRGIEQSPIAPLDPDDIVTARIDPDNGLLAAGNRGVIEYFRKGTQPKSAHAASSSDDFYKADSN